MKPNKTKYKHGKLGHPNNNIPVTNNGTQRDTIADFCTSFPIKKSVFDCNHHLVPISSPGAI